MKSISIPFITAVFVFQSVGFGIGIRVIDQDAEATARGDAFTATADNPSAVYYNPAGITQLQGENVSIGAYGIDLQSKYTAPDGEVVKTKNQPEAVPQIYYTYSFKDQPLSLGLGIYAPFGFVLQWPDTTPFRQMALQGRVTFLTVNPVIAWRIDSKFSIAAGVNVNYADALLERGILPTADNNFRLHGDGYGAGFNLGVMWQPTPQNSFGLSYHSESTIDLSGHSTVSIPGALYSRVPSNTDFTFPEYMEAGYSFRPTPDWNFELDIDWTDWHQLKTLTVNQQGTGAAALPFNWQSSFTYEAGVTRYFSNGYRLSAGYIYSQSSVPSASFNPVVPDSNLNMFSLGVGQTKGRYSWDLAYQFIYGPNRTVDNSSVVDDGTYRFLSHVVSLSFGCHF